MAKNDYLGPKLIIFGTKILILSGGSKSFGTHVTEKPPRHLVCIVFWSGIGSHGPKMPIFGQFWAKILPLLGQKSIFWGHGVKLLVPSYQGTNETPLSCWKHWPVRCGGGIHVKGFLVHAQRHVLKKDYNHYQSCLRWTSSGRTMSCRLSDWLWKIYNSRNAKTLKRHLFIFLPI